MNALPSTATTSSTHSSAVVEYGEAFDPVWIDPALGGLVGGLTNGIPLGVLLRATADECGSKNLAASLRKLASNLDRGMPLDAAVEASGVPESFAYVLRLARSGPLSEPLLRETLAHWNVEKEVQRELRDSVAYLTVLIVSALGLVVAILTTSVPRLRELFSSFGVELPFLTIAVLRLSEFVLVAWPFVLVGLLLITGLLWFGMSAGRSRSAILNFLAKIPPFRFILVRLAELRFVQLLALLVEGGQPLVSAIVESGEASGLHLVQTRAVATASRIQEGESAEVAFDSPGRWPALFALAFQWGKSPAEIADGLRLVAGMHRLRLLSSSTNLVVWMEPLIMLGIGILFLFVVTGCFMPLIKLLNDLS